MYSRSFLSNCVQKNDVRKEKQLKKSQINKTNQFCKLKPNIKADSRISVFLENLILSLDHIRIEFFVIFDESKKRSEKSCQIPFENDEMLRRSRSDLSQEIILVLDEFEKRHAVFDIRSAQILNIGFFSLDQLFDDVVSSNCFVVVFL